jgi:trimethylamine--corrinoid protein Co-methyltransferase
MLTNSTKPIVFTAWDEAGLADIIKMAELVAGGPEKLRLNPFLFAYLEPTSPLQHSEDVMRKVLMMVDHGLPFVYAPGPVDGASAPMTPAGSLAMANAEVLSGLVIAQQRRRGTPFLWGSGSGPMDMRHTTATYSSPEFMLHTMGMAELAHHTYNLPVWGFSGCSDSKLPDMQAGIESALWILWTALSGANLVHDVGYIESGLTCSPEMMVVGDEIIGFVRRLLSGIALTPETLALDVIDKVGPGGNYLAHKHTRNHFREMWLPRVFDRRMYQSWETAGRPTAHQSARELAREIVANHEVPPLAEETLAGLQAILHEADVKAGVD